VRSATDRRQPQRSDLRRRAILESLDHHLRESGFDGLNIADVARRAGVTRSAFYFYFENKAAAVAALLEPMYDDGFVASDILTSTAEPPHWRRTPSLPAGGHARRQGVQRGDPPGVG
jgi:AcrR family transcriptional regulator